MTRRKYIEILLQTGFVAALPGEGFSKVFLKGNSDYFFEKTQFKALEILCQTIIPKSETPGAIDAGVPHFVDMYLKNVASSENQKVFEKMFTGYLTHLQNLKISYKKTSKALTAQMEKDEKGEHRQFIKGLKVMVLKGYFMNEKAIRQSFQYVAVPGNYRADISKKELGKMWIN
jgi:hypothetical protein